MKTGHILEIWSEQKMMWIFQIIEIDAKQSQHAPLKTQAYSSYRLYNTSHGVESPCVKCLCVNLRQCPWNVISGPATYISTE